jgi:phosphoglycolate phosphatase-like HAD superfamily hydrolase
MPKFQAAIFDVDGVLVDSPHEKAWRESLRELMESGWRDIRDQTTWSPDAFTSHVYPRALLDQHTVVGGAPGTGFLVPAARTGRNEKPGPVVGWAVRHLWGAGAVRLRSRSGCSGP